MRRADVEQFKATVAAEIIKALDRDGLSVRAQAESRFLQFILLHQVPK